MELHQALAFARPRHHGVLATHKRDGRPQLSNVTYSLGDDDLVRVSITADRAKSKNLERDPRCSLYVGRDDFWAYVVLEGTASLSPVAAAPDDDTVEELVRVYREVLGEHPDWDEYRAAMVADRRRVVRLAVGYAYGMLPES